MAVFLGLLNEAKALTHGAPDLSESEPMCEELSGMRKRHHVKAGKPRTVGHAGGVENQRA